MADHDFDQTAQTLYNAGRDLLRQRQLDEAVNMLRRSAEAEPHFKTLELLGEALIELGRFKDAVVPLAAATTLNRQVRPPSLLAKALLASGNRPGAREAARMAAARDPSNRLASEVLSATAELSEDEDANRVTDLGATFDIRHAAPADIPLLARHRAAMFRDMGKLAPDMETVLVDATANYFRTALPRGEYVAWVAQSSESPPVAIGGVGVQLRAILPRPGFHRHELELGPEALVLNMYVEPAWRRRGVGKALMRAVLRELAERHVRRILLHASDAGRPLYQRLGFVATNEMKLSAHLASVIQLR